MRHRALANKYAKSNGGIKSIKYNLNEAIGSYTYGNNTGYHIEPTRKMKK